MNKLACNDFDQYVNGQWKQENSIPDDQTMYGNFIILREENLAKLRTICESDIGLVGKLYSKALVVPTRISLYVQDLLLDINNISSINDYLAVASNLFKNGIQSLFHICKSADDKNSDMNVPHIFQTGALGLPDKVYYFDEDKSALRAYYLLFIKELATLYDIQDFSALNVFAFEQTIAELHLARAECRDSDKTYNKMSATEVHSCLPTYFGNLNLPEMSYYIVQNPKLLQNISEVINNTSLDTLKQHLLLRVMLTLASFQTEEIVNLNFDFYGKKLQGQKQIKEPWKRALDKVSFFVGDELGKLYIEKHFDNLKSQQCYEMIIHIKTALYHKLDQSQWMSPQTIELAKKKLDVFKAQLGGPEEYHSIDGLWVNNELDTDISNIRLSWGVWDWKFEECDKFYTPVNKKLWGMNPQEVNACFNANENKIIFPAGILQLPFFGFDTPEQNLGGIGAVIAHEITHGFDDEGRKYNDKGELSEWWTAEDISKYKELAEVVKEHYSSLTFMDKPVNGSLTLGENIADIGGVKLALEALKVYYPNQEIPFDVYDRFFKTYANVWRMLTRKEVAHQRLITDPHSPAPIRINAVLSHIDEFYKTYGVTSEDALYLPPEKRMSIW